MKRIYIVHSVIPAYFTSAEKALKYAWANQTSSDPKAWEAWYLKQGKEKLHKDGVFVGFWIKSSGDSPYLTVTAEEVNEHLLHA